MNKRKPRLSRPEIADIARRHAAGASLRSIARRYGRAPSTISRVVRKARGQGRVLEGPICQAKFRLREDEHRAFRQAASDWGFVHMSQAHRSLVRLALGKFEVLPADLTGLLEGLAAFDKMGVNLNQIARKVNRNREILTSRERAELARALTELHRLGAAFDAVRAEARSRRGTVAGALKAARDAEMQP
ncbi:MAG: helix-turn-helix domain-containing protein [Pseudomonadota bacterium]